MNVQEIKVSDIYVDDDFNCRGDIRLIDVADLVRSITEKGLIQPVAVRIGKHGSKYDLVAGFRRTKAHQVMGKETIHAVLLGEMSDKDARVLNLNENLQRADLNVMQEARAVENLRKEGMSRDETAMAIGKSKGWVQIRFMLLDLPEDIQAEAAVNMFTQQEIRDLYTLRANKEQLFEAVRAIKDRKIKGEKSIRVAVPQKPATQKKARNRSETFIMQQHIQNILGNNFGTRCLAWAAGEISSLELYEEIKMLAEGEGKRYEIPKYDLPEVQE